MIKKIHTAMLAVLSASIMFSSVNAATSEQTFLEQREALIIKHSHKDPTFAAMQKETSFSKEYWRWRVDQYLYGQYPEYQPIYNDFTEGKSFNEIYDLPVESLGPKWQKPASLPAIPAGYFTDNLPGNAYTGWHKLIGDKVYVVYQGHLTDPYVASYDLKTHKWDGPYKAGHSTLSKGERKIDSHGRPIIEVDSQGYVHIVFGGHGGEREDGLNPLSIDTPHAGGRMLHVVSAKPYDLSQFVEKSDITPFASYTRSYKMANGDIYFFTRAGTHKSPWVYYKMKSGSQTFEPAVLITWPVPQKDNPIYVDTQYITPDKVSDTEIVITSLWHACNFHETHDKSNYGRLNAYYMKLDTTSDTFYNIKNEPLTLPLTLAAMDKYTLAYNSEKNNEISFGTKPVVLEDGRYAVAYEAMGDDYREWRMASFDDGKWSHGHPMPGTVNRTLQDADGKKIKKIQALEILQPTDSASKAVVTYQNSDGESIFALAKQMDNKGNKDNNAQNWQVEKTYFNAAKAKVQMEAVKAESGEVAAVILNVSKGASQRLYLWHEDKLRTNP